MRPIERIDPFLAEIGAIWKERFPDWRFGQLIYNFLNWYGKDPFYLEEEDFISAMEEQSRLNTLKEILSKFKEIKES